MLGCLLAASVVAHARQEPDPAARAATLRAEPYAAAVREYRAGRTAQSLDAALAWDDVDVKVAAWLHVRFASALTPPLPERVDVLDIEAAVLLHSQAALEAASAGRPVAGARHVTAALTLLGWLDRLESAREKAGLAPLPRAVPIRDWYVAAMIGFTRLGQPDAVVPMADDAAQRFPDDADIQVAAGAIDEVRMPTEPGRNGRREVLSAIARYRAALAARPDDFEAALRLGHVLSEQGKGPEAERMLALVARDGRDPRLRYLALLFLGRECERQRRGTEAAARFAAAVQAWPRGQAARTALAHALSTAGRTDEARAVLEPGLQAPVPRDMEADPYWSYHLGPLLNPAELFNRMVGRVRQ